jgi:mono/diheme cytochrome c family protein
MKHKILFLFFSLVMAATVMAVPPVEEGKTIFASRCAACHNVNKVLTGPALAGVHERRSMEWIVSFIKSSQSLVKSGDKDAVALYEQFNKIPMPDHPDLTEDNIKNIVEYIKSESQSGENKAPFAKPVKLRPAYTPLTIANYKFFLGYLTVVGMLIVTLLFAVQVKEIERSNLKS